MSDRAFETAVRSWLHAGSDVTPPAAIDAVLLAVKTTPQERSLWIPRRFNRMSNMTRLAAALAVLVIAGVGAFSLVGGGPPGASPTHSPSPTSPLTPSPGATLSFGSEFSSAVFGYAAWYPDTWRAEAGTTRGTAADIAITESDSEPARFWDHFNPVPDTSTGPSLVATSVALPSGLTEDEWIAEYQAPQIQQAGSQCVPARSTWETVTIDGRDGGIYVGCRFIEAMVFVDRQVFIFGYFNLSASPAGLATSGRATLEAFIDGVSLHPEWLAVPTAGPVAMEVQGDAASWTAVVPPGWSRGSGTYLTSGQGPAGPSGIAVAATGAVNVPSDPCDGVGEVSDADSPADVVAALEARDDLTVSTPTAASLGGHAGLQVDVEFPADLSACGTDAYIIFAEPDGSGFYAQGPSNRMKIWVLDVDGRPVVFFIESFAATPAADVAAAEDIIGSIAITP